MGIVAVTAKTGGMYKRDQAALIAGLILVLLVLSRYIVNGEPVDVCSDETEMTEALSLYDGMEIRQPLTVSEEMNWRQGFYALNFAVCDTSSAGQLLCVLEQGEERITDTILLREIRAGEWVRLDGLNLGQLECGEAQLHLSTEGVSAGELAVAAGPDHHGFGIAKQSQAAGELALAQAYHYHSMGMEYAVRLLCFWLVMAGSAALVLLTRTGRMGDERKCLAVFGVMTLMFMAVIYLLDSSLYLEPTYAEAVTNFLHYAREEGLGANLLITDAGYLPLLPRLITLFCVKVIRIPTVYALYFMQAAACLLCSMVWAFFVLYPFHGLMRLSGRILWCFLVMLTCFYEETLFFTNHAYWGIYLLLLLLAADLELFSRGIYAALLAAGALVCLSKGTYAVLLPLMMVYLLFFGRSLGRRDKALACVIGGASLLQLLYSFGGQGDGGRWVKASSMGQPSYWFRLVGRTFTDFGAYLLAPLGRKIQQMPGLVLVVTFLAAVFLAVHFTRKVLVPLLKGRTIDRRTAVFYGMVMFQLIVSAFYLLTVKRVPDSWQDIGRITIGQMGHKYEIFSNIGFYMLLLTGGAALRLGDNGGMAAGAWIAGSRREKEAAGCLGRYGVLTLLAVFCLTNPVLQLSGWKDAGISDGRVYAGDINAGWWENKELLSNSAFFVPVRGDNWGYSRNATLYQVGTDAYFEEVPCNNLAVKAPSGYQSEYEMPEEVQTQNVIQVMIEQPWRIDRPVCRVQLFDDKENLIAEARQTGSGRNKKCIFALTSPATGVKTIRFVDEKGEPVYFKDYIAWLHAW